MVLFFPPAIAGLESWRAGAGEGKRRHGLEAPRGAATRPFGAALLISKAVFFCPCIGFYTGEGEGCVLKSLRIIFFRGGGGEGKVIAVSLVP